MAALGAPAAHAHDLLVSSSPEDGDILQAAPEELVLSFNNEPLEQGAAVEVTDADGAVVAEGEPTYAGLDVVLDLPPLDAGDYEVSWTVVSSDGHRISDDPPLSFTVTGTTEGEPAASEDPTEAATEADAVPDETTSDPTTGTDSTDAPPGAGPSEGELVQDEEPSGAWRVVAIAATAAAVTAVLVALVVRIRRQQRDRDGR